MTAYPVRRLRRLRHSPALRRLVAETRLHPAQLVLPVFVKEGLDAPQPIASMPGVSQHPLSGLAAVVDDAVAAGIGGVMLFGVPATRDAVGSGAAGRAVGRVVTPLHARTDAADVEAAELRLTQEEAVGEQNVIDARAFTFLQRDDRPALGQDREDEARIADVPELLPAPAEADVTHVAAKPGKLGAERDGLAPRGPDARIQRVVVEAEADDRGEALADRIAQEAARAQRIAGAAGSPSDSTTSKRHGSCASRGWLPRYNCAARTRRRRLAASTDANPPPNELARRWRTSTNTSVSPVRPGSSITRSSSPCCSAGCGSKVTPDLKSITTCGQLWWKFSSAGVSH